jgi:radical SAM protein with 4Fe4S-binding SPASM domain
MINCSRLLRAYETAQEVREHRGREAHAVPKHLIRYSKVTSPMVVWNITKKCNLPCRVCHLGSAPEADVKELTTLEAKDLIDQMAAMRVPLISVYGGEPLTRGDFLELAGYAHEKGLRMIFSTNATLITKKIARKIKGSGISYVGIDLDGLAQQGGNGMDVLGGLKRATPAMEHLRAAGLGYGVRITVGDFNLSQLPSIVEAIEDAGIKRFAVCQLLEGRAWKAVKKERRKIMDFLIDYARKSPNMEVVTEHFYADGAYIVDRLSREDATKAEAVKELLALQGGCPAGRKLVNIDHLGVLHPCIYWKSYTFGSVKEEKLNALWKGGDPVLEALRNRSEYLKGGCRHCLHSSICGGCRNRAEKAFGDYLQQDPACYVPAKTL